MYSISILDADGRDVTQESVWLPMGREYHRSLRTPHRLTISEGPAEIASARVRQAGGTEHAIKIDSLRLSKGFTQPLLAALLYSGLREARIVGRTLAEIDPGDYRDAVCEVLRLAPSKGQPLCQRVDYGLHCTFEAAGADFQSIFIGTFPSEIVRSVEHRLEHFFSHSAWAKIIRGGLLSRRQYVGTLFSLHSYVRFTTRLLGHCIGMSSDSRLRAHYIEHLKGELNHERIIERDLKNLGEDVDYVVRFHQPASSTLGFMCIQESVVSFHRDPVLFLACPIGAESFAAYVQADILEGLQKSINGWGLKNPDEVTHFIRSHSGFDGGPEGHWNLCIQITKDYVQTQEKMQLFSAIVHAAIAALARIYDSCVLDYAELETKDGR